MYESGAQANLELGRRVRRLETIVFFQLLVIGYLIAPTVGFGPVDHFSVTSIDLIYLAIGTMLVWTLILGRAQLQRALQPVGIAPNRLRLVVPMLTFGAVGCLVPFAVSYFGWH